MKNLINNLIKFIYFLAVTEIIVAIIFSSMYFGVYRLINYIDPSIYMRYATNNKYDKNIFFCDENGVEILEQLVNETDLSEDTRIQDIARIVFKNQDELKIIIDENDEYQQYLIDSGSSVDELIEWSEKISKLDDNLSIACFYLTFLLVSFIMVVLFKFRKTFYIFAGTIYAVAILSTFSDGISDYLVANVLALIAKLSSDVFTYSDMEEIKLIFFGAFKESMLSFIIFDSVIQICQNNYKEKKVREVRYLYGSLEAQCAYLNQFRDLSKGYSAKLLVPKDEVVKRCDKMIKMNNKMLKGKKILPDTKKDLEKQNEELAQLKKLLEIYSNCGSMFTTNKHIFNLRQIQYLMRKYDIV